LLGKTVFDVGGEKGIFSLFLARAVGPNGRLDVFEPNPLQATEIRTNLKLNGFHHGTVHQAAVGQENGRAQLQFAKWRPGTGSLLRPPNDGGPTGAIDVDVVSLDDLVASGKLLPQAFVKIDVEGAELLVLRGMQAILQNHHPGLLIEVHDYGPDGESAARTIVEMLLAQSYQVSHVESGRELSSADQAEWLIGGHCAAVSSGLHT
jgi:FkbM family methyltransferase